MISKPHILVFLARCFSACVIVSQNATAAGLHGRGAWRHETPSGTKKTGRLEKARGDSGDDEDSGDEDEKDDDNDGDDDDDNRIDSRVLFSYSVSVDTPPVLIAEFFFTHLSLVRAVSGFNTLPVLIAESRF